MRKIAKKIFERFIYSDHALSVQIAIGTVLAEISEWGSCGEKAWALTHFLKKLGVNIRVEHFQIMRNEGTVQTKGNHTFIVLGREENSDPDDYATWGINAVICDPWSGKEYFVRNISQFLDDCLQVQYQYALLPVGDFKPAVNKIYFEKQGNHLNYYFTDNFGKFRKKVLHNIHYSQTLGEKDILPLFNDILFDLVQKKLIFEKVIVKHYEKPFHPFANSLKLMAEDGIKTLKLGLDIYYTDPYFGLEHGLNTYNYELIEQSFAELLKNDQELNWELFDSLDPDFKQTCFRKLLDLALKEQNNGIALRLLRLGYGSPAQIALIPELESNSFVIEEEYLAPAEVSEGEEASLFKNSY